MPPKCPRCGCYLQERRTHTYGESRLYCRPCEIADMEYERRAEAYAEYMDEQETECRDGV